MQDRKDYVLSNSINIHYLGRCIYLKTSKQNFHFENTVDTIAGRHIHTKSQFVDKHYM